MGLFATFAALAATLAALPPSVHAPLDVPADITKTAPSGVEVFQLVVSPEGTVVSCQAHILGRDPVRDVQNCRLLLRLRATPASDQEGHKIHGVVKIYATWMVYRAGQPAPLPASPSTEADLYLPVSQLPAGVREDVTNYLVLVVGADGKVETCEVGRSSGHSALDNASCRAIIANGTEPLKDKSGMAVRSVQGFEIGFKVQP